MEHTSHKETRHFGTQLQSKKSSQAKGQKNLVGPWFKKLMQTVSIHKARRIWIRHHLLVPQEFGRCFLRIPRRNPRDRYAGIYPNRPRQNDSPSSQTKVGNLIIITQSLYKTRKNRSWAQQGQSNAINFTTKWLKTGPENTKNTCRQFYLPAFASSPQKPAHAKCEWSIEGPTNDVQNANPLLKDEIFPRMWRR